MHGLCFTELALVSSQVTESELWAPQQHHHQVATFPKQDYQFRVRRLETALSGCQLPDRYHLVIRGDCIERLLGGEGGTLVGDIALAQTCAYRACGCRDAMPMKIGQGTCSRTANWRSGRGRWKSNGWRLALRLDRTSIPYLVPPTVCSKARGDPTFIFQLTELTSLRAFSLFFCCVC